jgi:long-chain fatty acid transport protein
MEINGKDTAAGFNASLLYTPLRNEDGKPLVNIGLVYRSQAALHLDGEFRANGALVANSTATAVLPQIFSGGIATWPVRDAIRELKLELDVDYAGWKSFRNLDVHLSNGATLPFPENWRNSFLVMLGMEHRWLRIPWLPDWEVAARGGYARSQSPIPDMTFSPAVPESDYNLMAIGLGLLCKKARPSWE